MSILNETSSIAIVTIATNKYVWYWKNLVESGNQYLDINNNWIFHVLTDQPDYCESISKQLGNIRVVIHQIEELNWEEATLLRYETILRVKSLIHSEIVVHLDADSLIQSDFSQNLDFRNWENGIALVNHPGFWRPNGISKFAFYFSNPRYIIKDLYKYMTHGGLGTWESNKNSTAFVPRKKRKIYVCGGTWMGRRSKIFEILEILSEQTKRDKLSGVKAKWFDESHLNKWAANNRFSLLSPEYCFAKGYANLNSILPKIIAVDKAEIQVPVRLEDS